MINHTPILSGIAKNIAHADVFDTPPILPAMTENVPAATALTDEQIVAHAENLSNSVDHGRQWGFDKPALLEFARAIAATALGMQWPEGMKS